MKKILQNRFVLWVLAPIAVICFLGWGYIQINFPTCTFRYKLTAEVNTPDGVKTGSSVIEVSYSHNADWGGGQTAYLHMTGEATYIDLGQSKNLFILLSNRTSDHADIFDRSNHDYKNDSRSLTPFSLPFSAFGLVWDFNKTNKLCRELSKIDTSKSFPIAFANLPTMVAFRQLGDPSSVELVLPDKIEEKIGAGFSLHRATLQKTDLDETKNIESVLRWLELKKPKESNSSWSRYDPLIDQLQYLSFKQ